MDKTVVIYKSKHGSTKKYAEWIGEELECPVLSADDFSKKELEDYENIIFGGCVSGRPAYGLRSHKKEHETSGGKEAGDICGGAEYHAERDQNAAERDKFQQTESCASHVLLLPRSL